MQWMRLTWGLVGALSSGPWWALGCGDAPGTPDSGTETEGVSATCEEGDDSDCLEVASRALILDPDEDAKNGITSVTFVDSTTLVFSGDDVALARLEPGVTFMRGVKGHGLILGRVTEVSTLAGGGRRVKFEPVRIHDITPRGRLRVRKRVSCEPVAGGGQKMACQLADAPGSGLPGLPASNGGSFSFESEEAALGISNCARTIWEDSGASWSGSLELTSCHFTVEFDVDINVSWGFVLPDGFSTSITMEADAGLGLLGEFEAGYSTGGDVRLVGIGPLTFNVAGIPMYVSGAIYAGYEFDIDADARFEASYEYDASETFGFGWAKGDGIYAIRDSDRSVTKNGPTFTVDGRTSARAYLKPEIEAGIGFDGVLSAGATVGLEAGARFEAELHTRNTQAEACASLDLYATPTLGYDLDVFMVVDKHGSLHLADWSDNVYADCISTEEMVDPTCETGNCDSDADCSWGLVTGDVSGAPRAILTPADRACVVGACDASGSRCSCSFVWTEGCCTRDKDCGEDAYCLRGVNRCIERVDPSEYTAPVGDLLRAECKEASECDDERPGTMDRCVDGDCVHGSVGGEAPAAFRCTKDSDCEDAKFCHGGRCTEVVVSPPCMLMSCNDGDVRTLDVCEDGECTHTSVSTLLSAPSP